MEILFKRRAVVRFWAGCTNIPQPSPCFEVQELEKHYWAISTGPPRVEEASGGGTLGWCFCHDLFHLFSVQSVKSWLFFTDVQYSLPYH